MYYNYHIYYNSSSDGTYRFSVGITDIQVLSLRAQRINSPTDEPVNIKRAVRFSAFGT